MLLVGRQVHGSAGDSKIVALFLKLIEADRDGLVIKPGILLKIGPCEPDSLCLDDYFVSEGDGVYPWAAEGQLSRPGKLAPSD